MPETLDNYSFPIDMQSTKAEEEKQQHKNAAIEAILKIKKKQKPVSLATIIKTRNQVCS